MKKTLNNSMIGTVVKIDKIGSRFIATNDKGDDFTSYIYPMSRKKAFNNNNALTVSEKTNGKLYWKATSMDEYNKKSHIPVHDTPVEIPKGVCLNAAAIFEESNFNILNKEKSLSNDNKAKYKKIADNINLKRKNEN